MTLARLLVTGAVMSVFAFSPVLVPRASVAQEAQQPLKTVEGREAGARAEILSLTRSEGELLTLRLAFVNDTGGTIQNKALPGSGDVETIQLFDFTNKRKYSVIKTSDGRCLCTTLNPFGSFEPGRRVFWAKFSAPPKSVSRISVLFQDDEPVDGVPIAN
jgi:hypothetical protein